VSWPSSARPLALNFTQTTRSPIQTLLPSTRRLLIFLSVYSLLCPSSALPARRLSLSATRAISCSRRRSPRSIAAKVSPRVCTPAPRPRGRSDFIWLPGFSHPTTISPSAFVTPYTPLDSDETEAATELQPGEPIKIQLGAQIDGFGSIVCNTVLVPPKDHALDQVVSGRPADLMLATHYANELLLRLMLPPGLLTEGSEEEKVKAAARKPPTQSQITAMLDRVVRSFDCSLVESTTSWLFERNEIEAAKKIVLAPAEGAKGEGVPEVGEVWGVEMGVSLGSGKVKQFEQRATLHRRTTHTYGLKRPTSRKILSEVQKKFGTFPFSLRQLEDERDAKSGVIECVRGNVFRQYEVVGDKDNAPVARLLTTIGRY
jgi:methionine aminopeptidase